MDVCEHMVVQLWHVKCQQSIDTASPKPVGICGCRATLNINKTAIVPRPTRWLNLSRSELRWKHIAMQCWADRIDDRPLCFILKIDWRFPGTCAQGHAYGERSGKWGRSPYCSKQRPLCEFLRIGLKSFLRIKIILKYIYIFYPIRRYFVYFDKYFNQLELRFDLQNAFEGTPLEMHVRYSNACSAVKRGMRIHASR